MNDYDLINVTLSRFMDRYVGLLSWKQRLTTESPFWGGSRAFDLEVEDGSLAGLIETLAEELYNLASIVGSPSDSESPGHSSGGKLRLPPWQDK